MKEYILKIISDNKTNLCHCYIDIDNFRDFNIINSYDYGNKRLEELDELIKVIISPTCLVRIGSDEFYLSFSDSFENLKESLFHLLNIIEKQFGFTVSIGVTEDTNLSPIELIKKLKHNTNIAKVYGKNKLFIE